VLENIQYFTGTHAEGVEQLQSFALHKSPLVIINPWEVMQKLCLLKTIPRLLTYWVCDLGQVILLFMPSCILFLTELVI
jgi:hypothetical protein